LRAPDTFNIDTAFAGTIDGGEGNDDFVVLAGGSLSNAGTAIDGGLDAAGDDTDTLNVAAVGGALTIDLGASTLEGFAGTETTTTPLVFTGGGSFDGIDALTGSGDETLNGAVAR
jgi:hypothetical protein